MSQYFSKSFHVSWNEINAVGEVRLPTYFQYIIETAWAWGAANGLGEAESEAAGLAWVMRETDLSIFRPLRSGDDFELTIWLRDWRRVRGTRCFELRIPDGGALIAHGVQEIVVLDSTTLRPVPAPTALIEHLRMENPRIVPHQEFPKYRSTAETAIVTERSVEWRDLDWQEHVNNSIYPAFAEEAGVQAVASVGWPLGELKAQGIAIVNRRVHIQYQSAASWGDRLRVDTFLVELKSTGGTWYVEMERLSDDEPIARCVLEWSVIDRASGAVKELPEGLSRRLQERIVVPGGTGS